MSKEKPSIIEFTVSAAFNEDRMRPRGGQGGYYVDAYIRPRVESLMQEMETEIHEICGRMQGELTEVVERYEAQLERMLETATRSKT